MIEVIGHISISLVIGWLCAMAAIIIIGPRMKGGLEAIWPLLMLAACACVAGSATWVVVALWPRL